MSLENSSWSPAPSAVKQSPNHPLSPLTAVEIRTAAEAVKAICPGRPDIHFKILTLDEPEKALLVPFLDAEHAGRKLPHIDRKVFVAYYIRNTVRSFPDITEQDQGWLKPSRTNFTKPLSTSQNERWKATGGLTLRSTRL